MKKKQPSKRRKPAALFAHRRHTARLLPKKHTSYPVVALLLLMVGVLLVFSTSSAAADDNITVNGVVDGGTPPAGATILSPTTGTHFSAVPITVSGTCEVGPGFYVKLFRNDIFSGSAACTSGGTFSISSDLFDGENILTAIEANAADVNGPTSAPVTVYYDPVVSNGGSGGPGPGSSSSRPGSGTGTRFYISPDHSYRAGFTGQDVTEILTFVGGRKPYRLIVKWGDGYSTTLEHITEGTVKLRHMYGTAANVRTYYTVDVQGYDTDGRTAYLQLFTIMNDPTIAGLMKKPPTIAGGLYHNPLLHGLLFAWPAYVITILMAITYWLGERRGEGIGVMLARRRKYVVRT